MDTPIFQQDCRNCGFCDGLKEMDEKKQPIEEEPPVKPTLSDLFKSLPFLDRYLAVFIFLAMLMGVLLGVYQENQVRDAFSGAGWEGVSIPVLIGLLVMIWPILTKIRYESLHTLFISDSQGLLWKHITLSIVLNWIIAPFLMLGIAWATLPEEKMSDERQGVILVGIARCIAMVLIWTGLARGDMEYCAILVCINSIMQIVLFSPYALLMINLLGGGSQTIHLEYSTVAKNVGIYLGIPLAAGVLTRFTAKAILKPAAFQQFLKRFGPLSLIGLLYTIVILFAYQGKQITNNIGSVFRIFVPLIIYFIMVWFTTFYALYKFKRSNLSKSIELGGYDKAVVQAFTAASNNFELAIAIAVASFGPQSKQALAATIGPLVEVPVLLLLSYAALWLKGKQDWDQPIALA